MIKLKAVIGLSILSALVLCAFAAQGASAQTWYECAPTVSGNFTDAHCDQPGVGIGYNHVALPGIIGAIDISNRTTGGELSIGKVKDVLAGVTLELQSTEIEGSGEAENKSEGATMWVQGSAPLSIRTSRSLRPRAKDVKSSGETSRPKNSP